MSQVLVSGGSGFLASHVIVRLLDAGHTVRATVRDPARVPSVCRQVRQGGGDPDGRLTFATAELLDERAWRSATAGCEYVLHVASPLPVHAPRHEDELIAPAREGTLNVLRAAREAGVRRVVLTSSFAAVGYGHAPARAPFDETAWTTLTAGVTAYAKSKTLAERAAWDYVATTGGALELAVVNPVVVLGPVLGPDYSASITLIKRLLDGGVPACPRLHIGLVDVRDVADLHVRAMTHPAAAGERFLAVAGDFVSLLSIAQVLRCRLGPLAQHVPTRELPDWLVRLAAQFSATLGQIVPELGKAKNATSAKAIRLLGWTPRPPADAIVAAAESLAALGLLKARR